MALVINGTVCSLAFLQTLISQDDSCNMWTCFGTIVHGILQKAAQYVRSQLLCAKQVKNTKTKLRAFVNPYRIVS